MAAGPKALQSLRCTAAAAAAMAAAMVVGLALLLTQQSRAGAPLISHLIRSGWLAGPLAQGSRGLQQRFPLPPPPPQLPPPGHCSLTSLLQPSDVQWSLSNGTADRLSIHGCSLRRFSHAEAMQCLAGKRLVFVGDSVTRYQYLTLLYFLERGSWPAPLGGVPGEPSVANEHEWPSWNDFLRGTSALFGGRELCDCFRADFVPGTGQKPPEDEKFENRFYLQQGAAAQGPGGSSSSSDIFVSHLTYTTYPNTLHGHFGFPPYPKGRQPCAPATCNFSADWAYHLAEGLAGPVKDLRPTHLVVNSGLWGSSNQLSPWPAIAAAGKAAVAAQGGRVIWRTTTANRGGPRLLVRPGHDKLAIQHTQAAGWELMDAYNITRPLVAMKPRPMWDGRHFLAVVYRELNLYLLNMICQPDGRDGEGSHDSGPGAALDTLAVDELAVDEGG